MSRPALLDKLFQTGKTLFKPALIPVDNTTIKEIGLFQTLRLKVDFIQIGLI